ncbi:hypothetical protein [Tenacibaculum sp. 47A_GOM-205m]|uniref:hypothetical protein n=1 Tax=Tenacibaculum sp. 47A_GOM-205m TaxID=1380384 RepID=UPI00048BB271|nr:hypothetical protein [Tenacibaculum sp. 47A_GOM-205m]
MKTLQRTVLLLSATSLMLLGTSCTSDEGTSENLRIKASSTNTFSQSKTAARTVNNAEVTISEFKLNISEIELEFDDSYYETTNDNFIDSDDEIELRGPFELDLLTGTTNITSLELPKASYEEIEFEFDKNTDASSDMFNKTVVIKGTINAIPFIFWHDFEEEIEVDFENAVTDIVVSESLTDVTINFDLNAMLSQVDLSLAIDGNEDGTIEISPEDLDGNKDLADQLKEKLKAVAELLDD